MAEVALVQVLYVITGTIRVLIMVMQLLMMGRALLSWIPLDDDNPIEDFLYTVTEPVIAPVRSVIEHFGWFEELPIDVSFLITFLLLSVLESLL